MKRLLITLAVLVAGCNAGAGHTGHWVKNMATKERGVAAIYIAGPHYYEVRLPSGNVVEWRPAEIVHDPDCPCLAKAEQE